MDALPFCDVVPVPLDTWWARGIVAVILLYDGLIIGLITWLIRHSRPWLTFWTSILFVAPGPLVVVAWAREGRPPWTLLNPMHQSWAALADVALAAMLGLAARCWKGHPLWRAQYESRSWLVRSLLVGFVVSLAFRLSESGVYDLLRYNSLLKVIHDLVCYFVLSTCLVYGCWPVIRRERRARIHVGRRSLAVHQLIPLLFLLWVGGLAHDMTVGLSPTWLHRPGSISQNGGRIISPSQTTYDPSPARRACDSR